MFIQLEDFPPFQEPNSRLAHVTLEDVHSFPTPESAKIAAPHSFLLSFLRLTESWPPSGASLRSGRATATAEPTTPSRCHPYHRSAVRRRSLTQETRTRGRRPSRTRTSSSATWHCRRATMRGGGGIPRVLVPTITASVFEGEAAPCGSGTRWRRRLEGTDRKSVV